MFAIENILIFLNKKVGGGGGGAGNFDKNKGAICKRDPNSLRKFLMENFNFFV